MTRFNFDSKLGHRSRQHQNLIASRLPGGQQVIFEFTGKSVPGIVQVVKEDYNKNGKWSATYWEVEFLTENTFGFVKTQDWETGEWLNSQRWPEAIKEFRMVNHEELNLDDDSIIRFIRSNWKNLASRLDKAEANSKVNGVTALKELLAAQEELAKVNAMMEEIVREVEQTEEAERMRQEAAAMRGRIVAAKAAMKKGVNLADLKSLLEM